MSMPKRLLGRSRTCPLQATTSYSGPRYLLMVLALVGDSTMTRFFFFRAGTGNSSWSGGGPVPASVPGLEGSPGAVVARFLNRLLLWTGAVRPGGVVPNLEGAVN